MQILAMIAGLGSLVCWIMTLVKMFQDKEDGGVLKGVIGIICPLWAFIWGWMYVGKNANKNLMLGWTAAILIGVVANFMTAAAVIATK